MKETYQKPVIEVINFDEQDFLTASGESCSHGHHYGWDDPQPGHGNDHGHGHNHGGKH